MGFLEGDFMIYEYTFVYDDTSVGKNQVTTHSFETKQSVDDLISYFDKKPWVSGRFYEDSIILRTIVLNKPKNASGVIWSASN